MSIFILCLMMSHNVLQAGVPAMIDQLLVDPLKSNFYSPFNNSLANAANIPETEKLECLDMA